MKTIDKRWWANEQNSINLNGKWTNKRHYNIPQYESTYHNSLYRKLLFKNFAEEENIPDIIYVNCPIIYTKLFTDIDSPNQELELEPSLYQQNYDKSWRDAPLNVVVKNNWTYSVRWKYLGFLHELWPYLENQNEHELYWYIKFLVIEWLTSWKTHKEVAKDIIKELKLLNFDNEILKRINKLVEDGDSLELEKFDWNTKILWYHFRWWEFIPFKEKEKLISLLEWDEVYSLLWNFLSIKEDYVYRAVNNQEWEEIKSKWWWTIPQTNFEKNIGPQVSMYSKKEWYAWVIIRIKADKSCYKYWWMAVPRIECYKPHFTKDIEVQWENWEWIGVDEYIKKAD